MRDKGTLILDSKRVYLIALLLTLLLTSGCVATGFLDYVGKKDQEAETVYDTLEVAQLEVLPEGSTLLLVLMDESHMKGRFRGLSPVTEVGLQVHSENPALFSSDPVRWVPQEEIATVVHIDTGRNLRTRASVVGLTFDTLLIVGLFVLLWGYRGGFMYGS